jgi:hypothetical protein
VYVDIPPLFVIFDFEGLSVTHLAQLIIYSEGKATDFVELANDHTIVLVGEKTSVPPGSSHAHSYRLSSCPCRTYSISFSVKHTHTPRTETCE